MYYFFFFFSSRRRHTRSTRDWSSDVCSSDLLTPAKADDDAVTADVHAPRLRGDQEVRRALEHDLPDLGETARDVRAHHDLRVLGEEALEVGSVVLVHDVEEPPHDRLGIQR